MELKSNLPVLVLNAADQLAVWSPGFEPSMLGRSSTKGASILLSFSNRLISWF